MSVCAKTWHCTDLLRDLACVFVSCVLTFDFSSLYSLSTSLSLLHSPFHFQILGFPPFLCHTLSSLTFYWFCPLTVGRHISGPALSVFASFGGCAWEREASLSSCAYIIQEWISFRVHPCHMSQSHFAPGQNKNYYLLLLKAFVLKNMYLNSLKLPRESVFKGARTKKWDTFHPWNSLKHCNISHINS